MKKSIYYLLAMLSILTSCTTEQDTLVVVPNSYRLRHDMTVQLQTTPSDNVSYSSMNTFHASVDDNGLVTGNRIGNTEIVVSRGKESISVPIMVAPMYNLYDDMMQYIGATRKDVTTAFGGSYIKKRVDNEEGYFYKDISKYTEETLFVFEEDKCKMIIVTVSVIYMDMLFDYLEERYWVVDVLNDMIYFGNEDFTKACCAGLDFDLGLIAVYVPLSTRDKSFVEMNNNIDARFYLNLPA